MTQRAPERSEPAGPPPPDNALPAGQRTARGAGAGGPFSSRWAWLICALCALLGLLLQLVPPRLPFAPAATAQQMSIWLAMALLLGLWLLRGLPALFAVLLVLLLMSLFGLAPAATLLAGAASDAVLWALGVLGLSVAARESGLLGWLMVRAAHSMAPGAAAPDAATLGVATPGAAACAWRRMPAVAWLLPAFALLPSPRQAGQWARLFELLPAGRPQARRDVAGAAQLCARLLWLPAHPANLLALALLPAGGLDRFIPIHWFIHTWPLALLALAYALCVQWLAPPAAGIAPPATALPACGEHERTALDGTAAIALAVACLVALQPFHGFAPGLITLPALAALFALQMLTPRNLQAAMDWPLFVSLMVLPGLVGCFAAALPPQATAWGDGGALPLALLLGLCLLAPAHVAIVCALVFAIPWAAEHRYDLLDVLVPVLAGFHLIQFLLQRHGGAAGRRRQIRAALLSPVTWLGCGAYCLWCRW